MEGGRGVNAGVGHRTVITPRSVLVTEVGGWAGRRESWEMMPRGFDPRGLPALKSFPPFHRKLQPSLAQGQGRPQKAQLPVLGGAEVGGRLYEL